MKRLKLKIPIYNCSIILKFTNDFLKYMKKHKTKLESEFKDCKGLCLTINSKHQIYILIKKRETYNYDTIVHECLHATNIILETRGVEVTTENDEAQAYLLGFIINQVQTYIRSI